MVSLTTEMPIRISGKITPSKHKVSVINVAELGCRGIRTNRRLFNGVNKMAKTSAQNTAPIKGHKIRPKAILTAKSSKRNVFLFEGRGSMSQA